MTQAQLGEATGINRALISRIEQQDFVPSIEQLENLGYVLDFDITELFTNSSSEKIASPSPIEYRRCRNRVCWSVYRNTASTT